MVEEYTSDPEAGGPSRHQGQSRLTLEILLMTIGLILPIVGDPQGPALEDQCRLSTRPATSRREATGSSPITPSHDRRAG